MPQELLSPTKQLEICLDTYMLHEQYVMLSVNSALDLLLRRYFFDSNKRRFYKGKDANCIKTKLNDSLPPHGKQC
jgi:hypothetical protein